MPIYEYRCDSCGHVTSILVRSFSDTSLPKCEACNSAAVTRNVSRPALIRSRGGSEAGTLQPADPRKTIQQMGEMYDQQGVDAGRGFDEIVSRAAAGDSPQELKEAMKEVRQKEPSPKSGAVQDRLDK